MCSPELPDLETSIVAPFDDPDLVAWLVNVGERYDEAMRFARQGDLTLPIVLDERQEHYDRFYVREDGFAPFPLHVVVNRDGEIVYLSQTYDAEALRGAIGAALGE